MIHSNIYLLYKKEEVCNKFNINLVPIDAEKIILADDHDVKYFIELSKRKSFLNTKVTAEGIVGRRVDDENTSFKVINPEWLLKTQGVIIMEYSGRTTAYEHKHTDWQKKGLNIGTECIQKELFLKHNGVIVQ